MPEKVKVIKSPVIPQWNKLPLTQIENIIFNITLPNGIIVTNPDQFNEIEEGNDVDKIENMVS